MDDHAKIGWGCGLFASFLFTFNQSFGFCETVAVFMTVPAIMAAAMKYAWSENK